MLQASSKAGRVLLRQPGLSLAPWALPGGSLPAAWLPAAAAACRSRAGFASDRRRTDGARSAAEDLAAAARNSVKHAAEGDVGAVAEDAVRMAQASMKGAAETSRLVFESVTGLNLTSASEGGPSVSSAASAAADAAGRAADNVASGASAVHRETVGEMSRTTVPGVAAKGPESTYCNVPGDWAGVMVESAVEPASPSFGSAFSPASSAAASGGTCTLGGEDIGASAKGSGAGGAGFASPSAAAGSGSLGGFGVVGTRGGSSTGGADLGSGVDERAFEEDELSLPEGPAGRAAGRATPPSALGSEGDSEFGREAAAMRATAEAIEAAEAAGSAPQGSVEDEFGVQGGGGKRQG